MHNKYCISSVAETAIGNKENKDSSGLKKNTEQFIIKKKCHIVHFIQLDNNCICIKLYLLLTYIIIIKNKIAFFRIIFVFYLKFTINMIYVDLQWNFYNFKLDLVEKRFFSFWNVQFCKFINFDYRSGVYVHEYLQYFPNSCFRDFIMIMNIYRTSRIHFPVILYLKLRKCHCNNFTICPISIQ